MDTPAPPPLPPFRLGSHRGDDEPEMPRPYDDRDNAGSSTEDWRKQLVSLSCSILLHLAVLVPLAWIVFAVPGTGGDAFLIISELDDPGEKAELASLGSDASATTFETPALESPRSLIAADHLATRPLEAVDPRAPPTPRELTFLPPPRPSMSFESLAEGVKTVRRSDPRQGGIVQGGSAGNATNGILNGIRRELSQGPVQIVWLMDASISMNVDRVEVAQRLYPFYQEMAKRDPKTSFALLSSVVRFGARPEEILRPNRNFERITEAVAAQQDDPSGLENVMTAVRYCLNLYAGWKGTLIIVVWTDESGDDTAMLEETLRHCREREAIVHVVGPNASFGSERGTHQWVDSNSGLSFLLPVKRGPETSLPERLMLPFWFSGDFPPAMMGGALVASGLPWYGGPMRDRVLSGFGPYALTRLALETGGTFTILNRPGDRTVGSFESMKPYIPDYSAAVDFYSEVKSSALRKTVVDASLIVWQAPSMDPPPTTFLFSRQNFYPFVPLIGYTPPELFRSQFRKELEAVLKGASAQQAIVEQALALYEQDDLEPLYDDETSPRWKAWYDLNYGRLLAQSVRLREYQLRCAAILSEGGLQKETNLVKFRPASTYLGGRVSEGRAVFAQRLLERCQVNNPDTPWSLLAGWELQHDLGVVADQIVIPIPRPGPAVSSPPATKPISFPKL
jgi:hypothetical protein